MSAIANKNALIQSVTQESKALLHGRGNLARDDLEYVAGKIPSLKDERLIYPAWVPGVYKPSPINFEAAREIERLRAAPTPEVEPFGFWDDQFKRMVYAYVADLSNDPTYTPLYTRPAPPSELMKAAEEAHSLLGELLTEATGDTEKEIYRVFDLLRYGLGIYAQKHPRTALDKVKS